MAKFDVNVAMRSAFQFHQAGELARARGMYERVLAVVPGHPEALHYLGVVAAQSGRHDVAVELIGRAVGVQPNYPAAHHNRGEALRAMGKLDEAIAEYRIALVQRPGRAEVYNHLGIALGQRGRVDEAIRAFGKAIGIRGDYADAYGNLGVALGEKRAFDEAIAAYRRAIALKANYPEAHHNMGEAMRELERYDEAIAEYRRAIALRPDYAEAHHHLGAALGQKGEFEESALECRRAIEIKPGYAAAFSCLGASLRELRQMEEAIGACRKSLEIEPGRAEPLNNLGNVFKELNRLDEAVAAYREAIAIDPGYARAHHNLGNALNQMGFVDEAIAELRRAIECDARFAEAHSSLLMTMHYHPGFDAKALGEEHRKWNGQHAEPLRKLIRAHGNDRNPDRRLRIGYVSPDLRDHPVGRFLLPILRHRDRGGFEVFAYSLNSIADGTTEKLRGDCDVWRQMFRLGPAAAADVIRGDGIDILVDLAMHSGQNALLNFAAKPAPVQVTYLAYCSTTGLGAMDYRLSDPYIDPPGGDESVYSERTIRLPGTYWCYEPIGGAGEMSPLPVLRGGGITFGCLNNFCKVSEPALDAWVEILRGVAGSRLILHAHEGSHRDRVGRRLEENGIDRGRLGFVGYLTAEKYFDQYRGIDICLDTFPFGGGTTTCDALWMGVPVVSLIGGTAVGRVGWSVLSNVGVPELAGRSVEEYVKLAVGLSGDISRLKELRGSLRNRMKRSPVMDGAGFTRGLEGVYRGMWRGWCGRAAN